MSASGTRSGSGSHPFVTSHVYLVRPEDQGRRRVLSVAMEDLEVMLHTCINIYSLTLLCMRRENKLLVFVSACVL